MLPIKMIPLPLLRFYSQHENGRIDDLLRSSQYEQLDLEDEIPLSERLNIRLEHLQVRHNTNRTGKVESLHPQALTVWRLDELTSTPCPKRLLLEAVGEQDALRDQVEEARATARGVIAGTEVLLQACKTRGDEPHSRDQYPSRWPPDPRDEGGDGHDDTCCGGRSSGDDCSPWQQRHGEQVERSKGGASPEGSLRGVSGGGSSAADGAVQEVCKGLSKLISLLEDGRSTRRQPDEGVPIPAIVASSQKSTEVGICLCDTAFPRFQASPGL